MSAANTGRTAKVATGDAELTAFQRHFVTPEGVDLRLNIATFSDRMSALILDLVFMSLALVAVTFLAIAAGISSLGNAEFVAAIWIGVFFFLRAFYFVFFELGRRAATPGKRIMGLRVVARDGGALRAESIFARNAMREVELFLPLGFLLGGSAGGVDGWIVLLGAGWSLIFALFPLFNRDRLRPGDLVGGTWVVKSPNLKLAADLATKSSASSERHSFTERELDAYGEHELKVLEDVLRVGQKDVMENVALKIRQRIGRPASSDDARAFLSAYYVALRQRLEGRMLVGRRRKDKFDRN